MTTFTLNPDHTYNETGRPWYDTKAGVEKAIATLGGLLRLRYERYQAGYVRKEKLNELYVLGHFFLDNVGNVAVFMGHLKKFLPDIPSVLTHSEFHAYTKEKLGDRAHGLGFDLDAFLPFEHILCPICQQGWSVENVHDVTTRRTGESVELTDFVGQPFVAVKKYYALKTDAHYFIGTEPFLRNKRFIDNTPIKPGSTTVKNSDGRVGTSDGIDDAYIVHPGDILYISIVHYWHKECNRKDMESKQKQIFKDIFTRAGFRVLALKSIPNEYCGCDLCPPWFEVKTRFRTFKIGWRKQVINIDWGRVTRRHKFLDLFADQNVAKGKDYIHAWGNDAVLTYLSKIAKCCKKK